jgi:UDP-N-acetylglucosamine 2-epimerase (non-hydrolysing)
MKLLSVVSSRPDLMKVASVCEAIGKFNSAGPVDEIEHVLVHTGRRRGTEASDFYFNDLDLPEPDLFLGIGSCSHSLSRGHFMQAFGNALSQQNPDVVLVLGDADAALDCAIVTKRTVCRRPSTGQPFIPKVGHIEAGLRSFDRQSADEINRVLTDAVADFLLTADRPSCSNLTGEGILPEKIHLVGNIRIDTLLRYRPRAEQSTILSDLHLAGDGCTRPYAVLTLHRSENVNNNAVLRRILRGLLEITRQIPIIFPARATALKTIERADLGELFIDHSLEGPEPWDSRVRIRLVPPLGYLDFLCLMSHARVTFTDSRGIQEESEFLGVPHVVLRDRIEGPLAAEGAAVLAGSDPQRIVEEFRKVIEARNTPRFPEACDGSAARRIIQILAEDHFRQLHSGLSAAGLSLRRMGGADPARTP